ncbi:hypothetical protein AKJ41_02195 [candidate division MSBL1 archaeon SCGC-AAA259O05]|uniref:ADP-ribosylglycohydrolase n=1 Tax=candidate division MSBL1 archaeon SCGC-AAA259O05 TaxID=1698271 RepID=A0A133V485_9EURY|nr:hypothetical protein AKJ41_02195 [candidate division MSBL1 archaeon SCGC-AAA259O05]
MRSIDTDCTGATLGSILGILKGAEGLPDNWIELLGDEIATNVRTGGLKNLNAPTNLQELTEQVHTIADKVLNYWNSDVKISSKGENSHRGKSIEKLANSWLKNIHRIV